jgi:anti-anti-sigma factor
MSDIDFASNRLSIVSFERIAIATFDDRNSEVGLHIMSPVVKIVRPFGLLDRTKVSKFDEEIESCISEEPDIVLIDFQDVSFMDSSGLGAIVSAIRTVQAAGATLFVCSINNQVKMLLELAGLDKVMKIFANREEFNREILNEDA